MTLGQAAEWGLGGHPWGTWEVSSQPAVIIQQPQLSRERRGILRPCPRHTCRVHTCHTGAQAQGPQVCLAPGVTLPVWLFQGPQSSPAPQGRGARMGSRMHTLSGPQGEPRHPPPGVAGHALCPLPSAPARPGAPGLGRASCWPSACDAAGGHTGAAELSVFRDRMSSSRGRPGP